MQGEARDLVKEGTVKIAIIDVCVYFDEFSRRFCQDNLLPHCLEHVRERAYLLQENVLPQITQIRSSRGFGCSFCPLCFVKHSREQYFCLG